MIWGAGRRNGGGGAALAAVLAFFLTVPSLHAQQATQTTSIDAPVFALETIPVSARVIRTDTLQGINGLLITFFFNGSSQAATTDSNGTATTTYALLAATGAYTLNSTWVGDGSFSTSNDLGTITVNQRPTSLVPNLTINVAFSENYEAQARLKDVRADTVLQGRTLNFKFEGGNPKSGVTDADGIAKVTYTAPSATGTYAYTVSFSSDATYGTANEAGSVIVGLRNTLVVPIDVVVLSTDTFLARAQLFRTPENTGINGKTVEFYFNGSTKTDTTEFVGLAEVTFKADILPSTASFIVSFLGDTEFKATTATGTVTISSRPVNLTAANASNVSPSQLFIASATLTDQTTGNPISSETLKFFFIGGSTKTAITNDVGLATVSFTAPSSTGTFIFNVTFSSTPLYIGDTDSGSAQVEKTITEITAQNTSIAAAEYFTASATLVETGNSQPIPGKTITFLFEGTAQTAVTDSLGLATTVFFSPSVIQAYALTAAFDGDLNNLGDSDDSLITVFRRTVSFSVEAVTAPVNSVFTASATLQDAATSALLNGETIEFIFNGTTQTALTGAGGNPSGVATSTFSAPSSSATLTYTAEFSTGSLYVGKKATGTLFAHYPFTQFTLEPVTVLTLKNFIATATLTEIQGGTPLTGRGMELIFENSTRTLTTNGLGVSSFTFIAPSSSGTYILIAQWGGDTGSYTAAVGTIAVNVLERPTLLGVPSQATNTLDLITASATLTETDQGAVEGATVAFLLNGTTQYGVTTLPLGLATTVFMAPASSGTYELQATFVSTGTYEAQVASAALTLSARIPGLSPHTAVSIANEIFTATATLSYLAGVVPGETIRFVIDGASQSAITNSLGEATTQYLTPSSSGTHTIEAYFDATPTYDAAAGFVTLTVSPRGTTLAAAPITNIINETFTASATLTDFKTLGVPGQTVRFVLNGATQTAVTDGTGLATTGYLTLGATGPYTLETYFDATPTYVGANDTAAVAILQRPTGLAAPAVTTRINKLFYATATLTDATSGAGIAGEYIRFIFNGGTTKYADTDFGAGAGIATATFTAPATSGPFTVEAYFGETAVYLASANVFSASILGDATELGGPDENREINLVFTASATLTQGGAAVNGETVRFVFNGSTQTDVTDITGLATTTYYIPSSSGTYPLEFYYDGSSVRDVSAATASVQAQPIPTSLGGESAAGAAFDSFVATATLRGGGSPLAGETIRFVIDDTTQSATTSGVGLASTTFIVPFSSGSHILQFYYDGTGTHGVSATTETLIVGQLPSTLDVVATTASAKSVVYATATLTTSTGILTGLPVRFVFANTTHTVLTGTLGEATTSFTAPSASSTYVLSAYFDDHPTYAAASSHTAVAVDQRVPILGLAPVTAPAQSVFTASATLSDFQGGVAGKTIRFVLNGDSQTATTDIAGLATTDYFMPEFAGSYVLESYFDEDAGYTSADATATLTADLVLPVLSGPSITVYINQVLTATATLTSSTGSLSGHDIRFKFGVDIQTGTTVLGEATTTFFAPSSSGTLRLDLEFDGDGTFAAVTSTVEVTVLPNPSVLAAPTRSTFTLQSFIASATLTTSGIPINGQTVLFALEGTTLTATAQTSVVGVATVTLSAPVSSGTYKLLVNYGGSDIFSISATTAAVFIASRPTNVSVTSTTVLALDLFYATATLRDIEGVLFGSTVNFVFDNQTHSVPTDVLGQAATGFFAPASSGSYRLDILFDETVTYASSAGSSTITVDPRATALAPSSATTVTNNVFTAGATLTDPAGALAGATVSFLFQGNTQTGVTDSLGRATTDFASPLSSGTYTLDVAFSTSPTFIGSTSSTLVYVDPRPTFLAAEPITVEITRNYIATATLTHSTGPISGRTINFFVLGVGSQTAITDSLGIATVTYTAPATTGTPVLQVAFDESPFFGFAAATAPIRYVGRPTSISAPKVSIQVGEVFHASATLVDVSTGPLKDHLVRFVLDGSTQTDLTDLLGEATTDFFAPVSTGVFTLGVYFDGSPTHAPTFSTAAITVSGLPTQLEFAVGISSALSVFTASATLNRLTGQVIAAEAIRFVLQSTTHTDVTDGLGHATTGFIAPATSGTHIVYAYFDGTPGFAASSATAILTVLQRESFLGGAPIVTIANGVFTATATVTDREGLARGATVFFYHLGSTATALSGTDGIAAATFTARATSGTVQIDFEVQDSPAYLASSATDTVTIVPRPTEVTIATFSVPALDFFLASATLRDVDGLIVGATMTFIFQGATQTAPTGLDGVATTGYFAPVTSGTLTLDVYIDTTPTYGASRSSAPIDVMRRQVLLRGNNVIVAENTPFIAVGDLFDLTTSTPLIGYPIRFHFGPSGPSTTTAFTNTVGRATVTFNSPSPGGTFEYNLTFDGDATYFPALATTTVFAGQQSFVIVSDVDSVVSSSVTLTALLKNNFAQPVPDETITFTFQGATKTATTNANGQASTVFDTPSLGGDLPFSAAFAGNGVLSPSSDDGLVHISLNLSLLVAFDNVVGQEVLFQAKAKLIDITTGGDISGKTIRFTFNGGTPSPAATNSLGIAATVFTAPAASGTYVLYASFEGDGDYKASDSSGTITVTEAQGQIGTALTKVVPKKVVTTAGAEFTAEAKLLDLDNNAGLTGKNLSFIFGADVTVAVTDALGVAKTTFTAPASSGAYTLAVQFTGDTSFNTSQATQTVAVSLLVPNDPPLLRYTVINSTQALLTWEAVTTAETGEDITGLVTGYPIETGPGPTGPWTQITLVSTSSTLSSTATIQSIATYYRVRTETTDGEKSAGKTITEVSASPLNVYLAPTGDAWISIPPGALSAALGSSTDTHIAVSTGSTSGFLRTYKFTAMKGKDKLTTAKPIGFGKNAVELSFAYGDILSGGGVSVHALAGREVAVFFDNGVEWIKLGGKQDAAKSRVSVRSSSLGAYALALSELASEFKFTKVAPRIFSPAEKDVLANRAVFFFENPADNDISIRIWDITGALIRTSLARDGSNMIYWDGKDDGEAFVKSGIYIYQIEGDGTVQTGTVVVAN